MRAMSDNFPADSSSAHVAGRLMVIGFEGRGYSGSLGRRLRALKPAGLILFARNISERGKTRALISDLQKLAREEIGEPFIISIDQEGGRVSRLADSAGRCPSARSVAETMSPEAARDLYRQMGSALKEIGVDLNFAPVLDIVAPDVDPSAVIGDRSYSSDPDVVASYAAAAVDGIRAAGLISCLKHFPGHGSSSVDSHFELPVDRRARDKIFATDLKLYEDFMSAGRIDMLMSAHILYPYLDPDYPATLSRRIIEGVARERIGFDGPIITDDLDMRALTDHWPDEEITRRALDARVDLLLIGESERRAENVARAIRDALETGRLGLDRVKGQSAKLSALFGSIERGF